MTEACNAGERFPRVLIVHHQCINESDQHSVSLREWFAEWPRENLAQIYSGGEVGEVRFCGQNYRLGARDRRLGALFLRLKRRSFGIYSLPVLDTCSECKTASFDRWFQWKHSMLRGAVASGLWEYIFSPILSRDMIAWVREFSPDVIYTQGCSIGFTYLPVALSKRLGMPMCLQMSDDWPRHLYSSAAFDLLSRRILEPGVRELMRCSSVRLATGERMAAEYHERYSVDFIPVMLCSDQKRFRSAVPRRLAPSDEVCIVYSGSIGSNRWKAFVDLNEVMRQLQEDGVKIQLHVFTPGVPVEALDILPSLSNVYLHGSLHDTETAATFKGADILFLPEPFDLPMARTMRLSISSKAHLYMMARRPILVYGHPETGVVDYAKRSDWSCVVDKPDKAALANALRELISNKELCSNLIERGAEAASQNHDADIVRERFRAALIGCCRKEAGCEIGI